MTAADPQFESLVEAFENQSTDKTNLKIDTRNWLREVLEMALVGVLIFIAINVLTARYTVLSVSMEPNLHEGERIIANNTAYWLDQPHRGDIVVVQPPAQEGPIPFVKRIIGLPGDEIAVSDGRVQVNGVTLNEAYISGPPTYSSQWIVGPNEYFVLGDNRNDSSDSHIWGMLPRTRILAKAIFRYWPPEKFGPFPQYNYPELEGNP